MDLSNPFLSISLLFAIWVSASRRFNPVGGWLLFYLIMLLALGVVSLFEFAIWTFKSMKPVIASESSFYTFNLLLTMLALIVRIAEVIVALGLLAKRFHHWNLIRFLRGILGFQILFIILILILGEVYRDWSLNSLYILFYATPIYWAPLWFPYFVMSKRVRSIFLYKNWDSFPSIIPK